LELFEMSVNIGEVYIPICDQIIEVAHEFGLGQHGQLVK
jgi:hypothetical protein